LLREASCALLIPDRAGFFPGAILLISRWYMPNESQTRVALFFMASASAGAFSGLLAYAIAKMNGLGGYEGWRWVGEASPLTPSLAILIYTDIYS
jgi:hypothetical protein